MKTRYVTFRNHMYEYQLVEQYLRDMALKGWIFSNFMLTDILVFQRGEPSEIAYYVDYYDGSLKSKEPKELAEYRKFVEEYGYRFIAGNRTLQVYERTHASLDIREESQENKAYLRKAVKHEAWMSASMSMIGLVLVYLNLRLLKRSDYVETMYVITIIVWAMNAMLNLGQLIPIVCWLRYGKVQHHVQSVLRRSRLHTYTLVLLLCVVLSFAGFQYVFLCLLLLGMTSLFLMIEHAVSDRTLKNKRKITSIIIMGLFTISTWFGYMKTKPIDPNAILMGEAISFSNGVTVNIYREESLFIEKSVYSIGSQTYQAWQVKDTPFATPIAQDVFENHLPWYFQETKQENVTICIGEAKAKSYGVQVTMKQDRTMLTAVFKETPTEKQLDKMIFYVGEFSRKSE